MPAQIPKSAEILWNINDYIARRQETRWIQFNWTWTHPCDIDMVYPLWINAQDEHLSASSICEALSAYLAVATGEAKPPSEYRLRMPTTEINMDDLPGFKADTIDFKLDVVPPSDPISRFQHLYRDRRLVHVFVQMTDRVAMPSYMAPPVQHMFVHSTQFAPLKEEHGVTRLHLADKASIPIDILDPIFNSFKHFVGAATAPPGQGKNTPEICTETTEIAANIFSGISQLREPERALRVFKDALPFQKSISWAREKSTMVQWVAHGVYAGAAQVPMLTFETNGNWFRSDYDMIEVAAGRLSAAWDPNDTFWKKDQNQDKTVDPRNLLRNTSDPRPSLTVVLGGPFMCVLGSAYYQGRLVVKPLTDVIHLDYRRTAGMNGYALAYKIARIFVALGKCVQILDSEYARKIQRARHATQDDGQKISLPLKGPPHYNKIMVNGAVRGIVYDGPVPSRGCDGDAFNDDNFCFLAHFEDDEDKKLLVRFSPEYCVDAHNLMASLGYAPPLIHSSCITEWTYFTRNPSVASVYSSPCHAGYLANTHSLPLTKYRMVITEAWDSGHLLQGASADLFRPDDLPRMKTTLGILHKHGFVLGDVRMANWGVGVHGAVRRPYITSFDAAGRFAFQIQQQAAADGTNGTNGKEKPATKIQHPRSRKVPTEMRLECPGQQQFRDLTPELDVAGLELSFGRLDLGERKKK